MLVLGRNMEWYIHWVFQSPGLLNPSLGLKFSEMFFFNHLPTLELWKKPCYYDDFI